MIRITTNGTLRTYQSNLAQSSNALYSAMSKLMTSRNFNAYSADPAAATRAFKIHSSLNATNAQASNNTTVLNKFSTAWDIEDDVIDKLTQDLVQVPALSGLNETNRSTLNAQGQVLRSAAESIVQSLNGKYGDDFIFGGADTKNPPFAIDEEGYLTYRNVRVDADLDKEYHDAEGNTWKSPDGDPMTNREVLDQWARDEHLYVDVGLGFRVENGQVVESTAFDSAISGLEFLDYGVDEDGDPKNVVSIALRLSEIYQGYDAETDTWSSAGNEEDAKRLAQKLTAAQEHMSQAHVTLDTEATYLESNQNRLESTFDSLNTERANIEDVDQVDAILELSWAQTCYNAALQVGANVIPQSLMDYLS